MTFLYPKSHDLNQQSSIDLRVFKQLKKANTGNIVLGTTQKDAEGYDAFIALADATETELEKYLHILDQIVQNADLKELSYTLKIIEMINKLTKSFKSFSFIKLSPPDIEKLENIRDTFKEYMNQILAVIGQFQYNQENDDDSLTSSNNEANQNILKADIQKVITKIQQFITLFDSNLLIYKSGRIPSNKVSQLIQPVIPAKIEDPDIVVGGKFNHHQMYVWN